jgi:hypothetical protein
MELRVSPQSSEAVLSKLLREFDPRFVHFDLSVRPRRDDLVVEGVVHFPHLAEAALHALKKEFLNAEIHAKVRVLTRDWPLRFAEVIPPCVMGLARPNGAPKEATTELLAGQIIRSFFRRDGWILCQAPDGYLGWLPADSVRSATTRRYLDWSQGRRWRILAPWRDSHKNEYRPGTEFLLHASGRIRLPATGETVVPPDGEVVDPAQNPLRERAIEIGREFLGVPYLWGGRTDRGLDCSGFVQTVYSRIGIALPRDANQQANMGLLVGYLPDFSDLLSGDLLFFMNPETAKIYHVGISLGGDRFLHSASKSGVIESRLSGGKKDSAATGYLRDYCLARRILV